MRNNCCGSSLPDEGYPSSGTVNEHSFFGMYRDDSRSVEETMKDLRKGRYSAI